MAKADYQIKLKKPYVFEEKEYSVIDLSKLENITGVDLEKANKLDAEVNVGSNPAAREITLGYCFVLASTVTGKPVEFYKNMPAPICIAIKNMVASFLYDSELIEE